MPNSLSPRRRWISFSRIGCCRASPTLDDEVGLDGCKSNAERDAQALLDAIQSVLDFTSACIEGQGGTDGSSHAELSVDTVRELRQNLLSVQHAFKTAFSTVGAYYEPNMLGEQDAVPALAREYLQCHLSGIPEAHRQASVDSKSATPTAVASEQQSAPLPLLAPHFFKHVCNARSGRTNDTALWPAIRESLAEELNYCECDSMEQDSARPVDAGVGPTQQATHRYPDLTPQSAVTAASGMTNEIDNMIHASAATGLDMTMCNTAAIPAKPPLRAPRSYIDLTTARIIEHMVRCTFCGLMQTCSAGAGRESADLCCREVLGF